MARRSIAKETELDPATARRPSDRAGRPDGRRQDHVGRRLAEKLGIPFVDADHEIEAAAGKTIPEIFADHGEAYFREASAG